MDRIRLNASEWMDFRSGEKKCFLLTNGLGGYCSLTVMENAARNDQALLMGAYGAGASDFECLGDVGGGWRGNGAVFTGVCESDAECGGVSVSGRI